MPRKAEMGVSPNGLQAASFRDCSRGGMALCMPFGSSSVLHSTTLTTAGVGLAVARAEGQSSPKSDCTQDEMHRDACFRESLLTPLLC